MRAPVITAAAVSVLCVCSSGAAAQSRSSLVPAVSISTVHDDNLFSRPNAVGDYLTQIRPSLEATFESPSTRIDAYGSFDMQMSARHSTLNSLDARRHALVEARTRPTPGLTMGLVGRYDTTENPGELNVESGVLLERQDARRFEVGPSLGSRVNSRTNLTTQYTWIHESLTGVAQLPTGNRQLVIGNPQQLHVGRTGVVRQATARLAWDASYLGRLFPDVATVPTHHSHAVLGGVTYQITPSTRFAVHAGPRSTSYRGTTFELLASYLRRTPRHRLQLDYWNGESIVLGIPGPVQVRSGTSKLSWTVRRNLELGTHFGVFQNTSLDGARVNVYHASILGAWNLSETYIVSMSYGADFQRGDIRSALLNDEHTRRGVFLARLTIAPRFNRGLEPDDSPTLSPPVKEVIR